MRPAAVVLAALVVACSGGATASAPAASSAAPMMQSAPPIGTVPPPPAVPAPTAGGSFLAQGLDLPACGATPLRVSPVRVEHIATLSPVGTLVPPDHVFPTPHMYFYVKNDATPADIQVPVYSPADLVITSIALRHYDRIGSRTDYTDYTLTFAVCAGLEMYFHHVRSLTHPGLVEALRAASCRPAGTGNETFCSVPASVRIAAGEPMATTGDRAAGVGGLDVGARDYRLATGRTAFASPDRWCASGSSRNVYDHCYTVCPLDYLPAAEREPLLGRFADFSRSVTRTDEPRCGTIYSDRAGSAQGRWIRPGTPVQNEGPHLYLGPTAFTSAFQELSMGTSVPGVQGGAYIFTPAATGLVNRGFADITGDGVHCYEQLRRTLIAGPATPPAAAFTILLQLRAGGSRLAIERRDQQACGPGPWTVGGAATVFER